MVSTTTVSRNKKEKILKVILNDVIEILLMEKRQRDPIRLGRFKRVMSEVKEILEEARFVKSANENST